MPTALDTNVLIYAERFARHKDDAIKIALAARLLSDLPIEETRVPAQAAGELYHVLTQRGGWTRADAGAAAVRWLNRFAVIETSQSVIAAAFELCVRHQFSIWDAIILSAAAEARCDLLLSEDLHHGFAWRGVTVVNPFAARPHPLLAAVLRRSTGD